MAQWKFPKTARASVRRRFADIFGKNTWQFRPKTCITTYDGERAVGPYRVLWADDQSAIVLFSWRGGKACRQLFFVQERCFFIVASPNTGNVEFFKRHAV
jgi:hypothetical protein